MFNDTVGWYEKIRQQESREGVGVGAWVWISSFYTHTHTLKMATAKQFNLFSPATVRGSLWLSISFKRTSRHLFKSPTIFEFVATVVSP
jgi:hypothetical protein